MITRFGLVLPCKELIYESKKNIAGGGLRFLALLAAITSLLSITLIGTTAQAANAYDPPECAAWEKISSDPAWLSDYLSYNILPPINVSYTITGRYSCGADMAKYTFSAYITGTSLSKVSMVLAKRDGGIRIWYQNLAIGSTFEVPLGSNYIYENPNVGKVYSAPGPTGKGIFSWTTVRGITQNSGSLDMSFTTTESNPILQVNLLVGNNDNARNSSIPVLDANGGTFPDKEQLKTPVLSTKTGLDEWTTSNTPVKDGYVFKQWSTDVAGTHPLAGGAKVDYGTHLYAQYEKASGKPQKVDFDCSTGGRCELTVNYTDSPAKTREFQPGNNELTWTGSPIDGVLLDASGYAADGACSDTRCWYVSLKNAPQTPTSYQAQMPTTGAPEGLSAAGVIAACVGVFGLLLMVKRRRD